MDVDKTLATLPDEDLKILQDQFRLMHGLEVPNRRIQPTARTRTEPSDSPAPKLNKTSTIRRQCVEKRRKNLDKYEMDELEELKRMHRLNLVKKKKIIFKLNNAFQMRWKNIRKNPVIHSHFRKTFLDTGKPPFVIPVHYTPFNVYWDADWSKEEFIFLGDPKDKNKNESKNDGTDASTTTAKPKGTATSANSVSTTTATTSNPTATVMSANTEMQITSTTPSIKLTEIAGENLPRIENVTGDMVAESTWRTTRAATSAQLSDFE